MSAPSWSELETIIHEALARAPVDRLPSCRCAAGRLDSEAQVDTLLRPRDSAASAFEVPPMTSQPRLKAARARPGPSDCRAWRRRYGRGVSRARYQAGNVAISFPGGGSGRRGAPRAVRARSQDPRLAQPPRYRDCPRRLEQTCDVYALVMELVRRARFVHAHRAWTDTAVRRFAHRETDRRGARSGAREADHSP